VQKSQLAPAEQNVAAAKRIGTDILWPDLLAMAAIATVLLVACILRFRKSLD